MKIFEIPIGLTTTGYVKIKAENIDEAIEMIDDMSVGEIKNSLEDFSDELDVEGIDYDNIIDLGGI